MTKRKIADLSSHPDQLEIFGDLSAVEFQALKDDISDKGILKPIEITPEGVIIDGHQRVRACQQLGLAEIDVVVCEGLDEDEVKERFINANLIRRQLDPIAKARAIKELAEIEYSRKGDRHDAERNLEFREHLAVQLGRTMSGRNVGRYLQILRLPRAIQDAVSARKLPMTKAIEVEPLGREVQQEIAARISNGEPARDVVAEYVTPPRTTNQTTKEIYRKLVELLEKNIAKLAADEESLPGAAGSHETTATILERAMGFCERMHQLERAAKPRETGMVRGNVAGLHH